MVDVKREFNKRVFEIDLYFKYLKGITQENGNLVYPNGAVERFDIDIKRILIANSFLLLYNLSEASITRSIEEIYVAIDSSTTDFDSLKVGIKTEIIKYLKSNVNANDFAVSVNNIAVDIILKCFDNSKILSGNLDARKIRRLATTYGFSNSTQPFTVDGATQILNTDNLLTVKSKRNDLAHGVYSFKECGKNYTYQDVEEIKIHVIEYLRQIIENIEIYISSRTYLN